jgi:REP element-mobilizing transposase RayT
MARQRRIEFEGAVYHVMARGDRREAIFLGDGDREAFLRALGDMCGRTGIVIHAYVLLDNHYHLVLETPQANLVAGVRWLQNTYTRRFNVCHRLWGHVFGGRYKAIVIDPEGDYFRRVVDYVHLNPARAGLAGIESGLERHPWSSLAIFMKPPSKRPEWLSGRRFFGACGLRDTVRGRRAYLDGLEAVVRAQGAKRAGLVDPKSMPGSSLQTTVRRGWYFGSEAFKERMLERLKGQKSPARRGPEDGYHGEQRRDHGEARARRIVQSGCETLGIERESLLAAKANHKAKLLIAELIATETSMRLDWVRAMLGMGSRGNCCRLIAAQRRRLPESKSLQRARARILKCVNMQ